MKKMRPFMKSSTITVLGTNPAYSKWERRVRVSLHFLNHKALYVLGWIWGNYPPGTGDLTWKHVNAAKTNLPTKVHHGEIILDNNIGPVAQLAELPALNRRVESSSLSRSTKFPSLTFL